MDITYENYLEAMNALGEDTDILSAEEFDALSEEELEEISSGAAMAAYNSAIDKADSAKHKGVKKEYDRQADKFYNYAGKKADIEDNQKEIDNLSNAKKKRLGINKSVKEETSAAATLKPKGAPGDPMSKIEAMKGVMSSMAGMEKSDLIDFFNQVQSQYGPGKDWGVGDKSGHNQSTLDMKPSDAVASKGPKTKDSMPKLNVKEDIEEIFDGQDLSEEFKESVGTLFEAAVSARIIAETARLEEEYEAALQEEIANFNEEVTSKLDTYLDYVVENWMKENEVAIESALRNEIMEDFVEGLRNLFAENYINVPEEQVDVLEALAEKVQALEEKLDETISENVELRNSLVESQAQDVFEELASDLALTQQEKFAALAEGIEFDGNLETYAKKLMIVKENYFKDGSTTTSSSNFEEETFEGTISESVNVDPIVNRYVQAIARTVKK